MVVVVVVGVVGVVVLVVVGRSAAPSLLDCAHSITAVVSHLGVVTSESSPLRILVTRIARKKRSL